MLVELPFASFFSCKLLSKHGTDVDIHHLESLDPEMYRYHGSCLSLIFVHHSLFTPYDCLFVLYLTTDINTISNFVVKENGEKGCVRRFHLLKGMRCGELGYLTWHCFYVHYNVCLFFSICFFLFSDVPRNLLFLKNYTGNVEDLSLNFTVVNNDLGESQVIEKLPTKVTTGLCIYYSIKLLSVSKQNAPVSLYSSPLRTFRGTPLAAGSEKW